MVVVVGGEHGDWCFEVKMLGVMVKKERERKEWYEDGGDGKMP